MPKESVLELPFTGQEKSVSTSQWAPVFQVTGLNEWQIKLVEKMIEMGQHGRNWDGKNSPGPTVGVRTNALRLLLPINLDNLPIPFVSPVSGGGIQIELRDGRKELELEFNPDGRVEYLKVENNIPIKEDYLSSKDSVEVQTLIQWLISR